VTELLTPPDPEPDQLARPPVAPKERLTRRQLLGTGLGGAVVLAGAGVGVDRLLSGGGDALPPNGTAQRFISRPDLHPTVVRYTATAAQSPGLLFVGPDRSPPVQGGAMILDGPQLVWFMPLPHRYWATNLQVRALHGAPVLTWWQGRLDTAGYGLGEAIIADTSYRVLHRIRAARGRTVDLHEFQLTPEGTALFTCTPQAVVKDLSSIGGPRAAHVLESIFQEVDVASGRLIREWNSLDHIALADSYRKEYAPFDYLHLNSIDVLPDGNLLVSARNTWCAYKLDRVSGDVIWRLGGKRTDFAMGPGAQFAWQHDARDVGGGRMTIFDDGFDGRVKTHKRSRGLVLNVDQRSRRVTVRDAYTSPAGLLTSGMGNAQLLPNGHMIVGFGDDPYTTEFAPDGRVVANLRMPVGQHSYRGFRLDWQTRGSGDPAVAVRRRNGQATLFASWNGATSVARWRILGGARASDLAPIADAPRTGFETEARLGNGEGFVQAVALDAGGHELARSAVVRA
jgi:hypothetical protein